MACVLLCPLLKGKVMQMKSKLLVLALLAAGSVFAQSRFSIGIGIGTPGYYAPPPVYGYAPPYPGPGYQWADGYRGPAGWVAGYWYLPPVPRYSYRPYGYRYNVVPYRGYYRGNGYRGYDRGPRGNGWRGRR